MAIIGAAWSSALFASLSGKGFIGTKLLDFTNAIGNGSALHVVGKPFTTTDGGFIPGAGVGVGVGITGLVGANASSGIFSKAVINFGGSGAKLQDVTDSLGDALVSQMALATLASTHSPVFSGSGSVDVGSVGVDAAGWASSIEGFGSGAGFLGTHWPSFADAIGTGYANEVLASGTGTVVITGTATGTPVGGVGVGAGTIS